MVFLQIHFQLFAFAAEVRHLVDPKPRGGGIHARSVHILLLLLSSHPTDAGCVGWLLVGEKLENKDLLSAFQIYYFLNLALKKRHLEKALLLCSCTQECYYEYCFLMFSVYI